MPSPKKKKKTFEIEPLASFSWLIHSKEAFCFLAEDQQFQYNIQPPDKNPV